ncbi:TetR/AcrR family transcriptional regulator [Virgibacillus sp. NKC19-3]|uniref:TetR/AcrR family transcriptional regulator n=1 Tax=Virgibacillus saliphilus TaxID=2831674 RepID=UPI001C9A9B52|nr:TetR/AcrR family transcriptional regulator [Virgibacillus sp. NKC19-3]MBY7142638.1 TetR/AcrR family transcriptional regulator [Virgibacillus sp. NKC19-3]
MSRELQAQQTKTKILEAAVELFFTKGYEQTTMQNIMHATKLSKGALYHHFKSKQEILEYYTMQQQQLITNYFQELADNQNLTATQKLDHVIDYLIDNDDLPALTKAGWAEKVPFALLHTLRNMLNVLAPYLAEIIKQGVDQRAFNCHYPKEIAELLMLLVDIWLDPLIVSFNYEEICKKIDFIILLLEKFDAPIISEEKENKIKERMKRYHD